MDGKGLVRLEDVKWKDFFDNRHNINFNIFISELGKNGKYISRASWDEFFMSLAIDLAKRASCIKRHVGAVIERNHEIISAGYNGAPRGVASCYERLQSGFGENSCYKKAAGIADGHHNSGECMAIHAEENALYRIGKQGDANDCTMYSVLHPCIECSRRIAGLGIKKVVHLLPYDDKEKARALQIFNEAGIIIKELTEFTPARYMELVFQPFQ